MCLQGRIWSNAVPLAGAPAGNVRLLSVLGHSGQDKSSRGTSRSAASSPGFVRECRETSRPDRVEI